MRKRWDTFLRDEWLKSGEEGGIGINHEKRGDHRHRRGIVVLRDDN